MQVFEIGGRWFTAYIDHAGRVRNWLLPVRDREAAETVNRELQVRELRARELLLAEIARRG